MAIEVVRGDRLSSEHWDRWRELQHGSPLLFNPQFSPEFTEAVAAVRDDIEVAIFKSGGDLKAFLPYQRCRWNVGRAVGHLISEVSGVVGPPDFQFDPRELLKACRLTAFRFNSVPNVQAAFAPFCIRRFDFPYIDISNGFTAFQENRRQAGSGGLSQALRKARKLEREVGPLRLAWHTRDSDAYRSLLRWKSAQYARIGSIDYLKIPWIAELMQRLLEIQTELFSGVFTVLYANEIPVAAHMGFVANGALAWIFPSYDTAYQSYSPGMVFLAKQLEACQEYGIKRVDLGPGDERYKLSFQTGAFDVGEGSIESWPPVHAIGKGWVYLRERVSSSSLLNGSALAAFQRMRKSLTN